MNKIRVLVVDDQAVVREGIVAILSYFSDVEVVGEAHDGTIAVELAQQRDPDVVLLDLVMKGQDGLTTIPQLRKLAPASKILVLTSFDEGDLVFRAIKAGALGYLLKDASHEQLLEAIHDVAEGRASLDPTIAMMLIQEITQERSLLTTASLTKRENETLQLIARGLSNQQIAEILVVHERTVAKYVSRILNKLHLANRTQAALYALRMQGHVQAAPLTPDLQGWAFAAE
jgi:NarL family two-component system response regulator LiaR